MDLLSPKYLLFAIVDALLFQVCRAMVAPSPCWHLRNSPFQT
jgi:hypothetical protein